MSLSRISVSYYKSFGAKGALAFLSHRFAGRPREIEARTKGMESPVHVRVGTSDAWLYREILLRGQYALDIPFTPRTIVDAGGNIGLASIYYARRYPLARVISVEAEASNFEILRRNVSPFANIVPVHAALWKQDGFISVSGRDNATNGRDKWGFITHEGGGARVRAVTMPTLMREHNIASIDLLKVDIEGSEKELFESCDWADRVQALAIELHDHFRPGCSAAVNAAMSEFQASEHGEIKLYLRSEPQSRSAERQASRCRL
jgi:FkbM family methyltransferase